MKWRSAVAAGGISTLILAGLFSSRPSSAPAPEPVKTTGAKLIAMTHLPPVVLTDEEQEECQRTIRELTQTDEGEWVVREEHAESFQRGIIAHCLMNRAERFLGMAGGNTVHIMFHLPYYSPGQSLDAELAEKACVSAAKACAIYPLPIYMFDFGCILYQIGKMDEAQVAFANFLSALEKGKLDPLAESWNANRDISSSAKIAKELIGQSTS